MGLKHSKKKSKDNSDTTLINETQQSEHETVKRLRKDLEENPEMFVVNNILMSFQFYSNFEREMEELRRNQVSKRELEINKSLADFQKHCLLPDTVMECVNERVRYRPFHGVKKFESEALLSQRMFIIHDNIEILYEGETSEYSTVDGPIHRAVLERAENQGYVQIRQMEYLNVKRQNEDLELEEDKQKLSNQNLSSAASTPPSTPGKQRLFTKNVTNPENHFTFSENVSPDGKRLSSKKKLFRTHSFTLVNNVQSNLKLKETLSVDNIQKEVEKNEEEEYAYTTLRRLTAVKLLDEVLTHNTFSNFSDLPANCIKEIKVRKIILDEDDDDDDNSIVNGKRRPPKKKKVEDFYDTKRFFNSTEFAIHFCDVFKMMYQNLGFSEDSRTRATFQGGKVYCEGLDKQNNYVLYEVIPTVATSWPAIAFEWCHRQRSEIVDPTTKRIYQWPTYLMAKKVQSFQANVLPVGYLAKRGINVKNELEWSLAFPAAERYLETCMSHSQIRCYLFILALYKTFMEPNNTKLALAPHHILNLMFWECEKNYLTWPEDRLGSKMIKILLVLYNYLAKGYLPDYFVRERNLFESIPSKNLRVSQSKLHDIIERPAVHVLSAIRNLRYTKGNFFPTLNFKNLYQILTISDSLALINPALSVLVENNTTPEETEEINEFKENSTPFWPSIQKNEDRERKWKRELRKQLELEKKEENLKKLRRESVDSIDLQVRVLQLDSYRKRCLLEFFIMHFMEIATKCYQYESYNYAIIILEHCQSLAILLSYEPSGEVEARPWKMKINDQLDKCRQKQQKSAKIVDTNRVVTFNIEKNEQNTENNLEENMLRKKRPANLKINAEIHSVDMPSPLKSATSQTSIILASNLGDNSTDL